jgi:hypothetical protein
MPEQVESGAEMLIEDRHLAIEHERWHGQARDRRGELTEPTRMIDASAAQ